MNKILIVILIVSLFFIEGCTFIGLGIGSKTYKKDSFKIEKIESVEANSWLTISLKNNEVIECQFISCINDTLFVTYQSSTNFTPISNSQFLSISSNKIFYKVPIDQIRDIQIRKADFRTMGLIIGIIIDLISYQVFKMVFIHNFKMPNFFK